MRWVLSIRRCRQQLSLALATRRPRYNNNNNNNNNIPLQREGFRPTQRYDGVQFEPCALSTCVFETKFKSFSSSSLSSCSVVGPSFAQSSDVEQTSGIPLNSKTATGIELNSTVSGGRNDPANAVVDVEGDDNDDNDDCDAPTFIETTLVDAPTEEERLAAAAAAAALKAKNTVTVKVMFCYTKWEVFPGAIVRDAEGPLHVSLHDIQDIQQKAQEFYQDWDTPLTGIHIDYYDGTEWKFLHDIALLEPYKLQKKAVPVRVARFFDNPDTMTIPYRNCV
jgi:hypothetical protein